MNIDVEYEVLIKDLKAEFLAYKQWEAFCRQDAHGGADARARLQASASAYYGHLRELRHFVRRHAAQFDARRISSLLAVPTQPLGADEMIMHRIWLGGALPDLARESIRQWDCALDDIGPLDAGPYRLMLWVWDAEQLRGDPCFHPAPGAQHVIGTYLCGARLLTVHSLQALAQEHGADIAPLLAQLHRKRYFVNLADYFRLLILHRCGGMYLDADTLPYRAATLFLCKPEVPDYVSFAVNRDSGHIDASFVCWMNLFNDENGVLIARKATPAMAQLIAHIDANLAAMGPGVPDKTAHSAAWTAALHSATYGVWQGTIGRSLTAYHDLAARHGVLHDDATENIVSGLHGMRLSVDALTRAPVPLTGAEQHSYERCIDALEQRHWTLPDIRDLAGVAQVLTTTELPRMAYAAQLRAWAEGCHYYSFLSQDPKLDRVNALFSAYLMAINADQIRRGNFWRKTRGADTRRERRYASVHATATRIHSAHANER
ncbi:glycosyltransferase [Massilia pseudoviolaceinigra]|uniref:glycosyltransferase n=1 Tax=Massilia pseudoviolaceinigra TaxID=3057165 RepID=UPI0027965359|nr:glycosyltransferase [Massilia sp. CCM 9206]MDQ1922724.1 glycosyltransferase [Massilia sp. CCM 9206]